MVALAFYYVRWHYTYALTDLVNIVRNFVWFFYEFFSIPLLAKTLFVPFHRLSEQSHGFNLEAWGEALLVNTLMRFVGALLRITLIVLGTVCIVLTFVAGIVFFVAWLLVPFILTFVVGTALALVAIG